MPAVALDFIQYNERMVGEDSPDYSDTLNRALKTAVSASGADEDLFVGFALRPLVAPVVGQFYVATDTDVAAAWTTLTTAMISDLTSASTGITRVGTITTGVWQASSIGTTYTDAKVKTVTGTAGRLTVGGTATDPTFDLSTSYVGQATITTLGTIATGVWNGSVIGLAYTVAQLTSLTGTANRITLTGTATAPIVDIAAAYSGQTSIVTLGTVTTGAWQGTSISTTYTDAKVVSVTGTSSRILIGGTAGAPTVDIDSAYIGQGSITTVGTITTGTWHGTAIGTAYTDAQVVSVSGVTNRTTTGGTSTNPTVDIAATYVGQASITTLGTIATGTWNGTVVTTTYTEAKVKTATGTANRLTVGGTATDPTFDISTAYVGQATITTVGTIITGTWAASTITVDKGGTNLTGYAVGDLVYASGATTLTRLPVGTAAQMLVVNGGATAPAWHTLVAADVTDLATATTGITKVGTVTTGVWNAGVIPGQYGGTGVNNASKTITLGGSLTTSGAFNTTLTVTADTNITLPTSGTVVTTAVTTLSSLSSVNGQTISATASFTGTMTVATGFTVSAGGASITGNTAIVGTLTGLTGVTVNSGGVTVSAGGVTITAGGLSVSANGITVTGASTITGTLGGITTLTATTIGGTLSTAAQPNITSTGVLAALHATGLVVDSGGITVTAGGALISSGGLTVTAGGLTVSASGITVTGASTITGTLGGVTNLTVAGTVSGVTTLSMSSTLTMTATASQIVPGATSFAIRNNANNANNLLISDAGVVTPRGNILMGGNTVAFAGTVHQIFSASSDLLQLSAGNVNCLQLGFNTAYFPSMGTSGSAANAYLDAGDSNKIYRSTSSLRYKSVRGDVAIDEARAIMSGLTAFWYNSKADSDLVDGKIDPNRWFIGFAAERAAALDVTRGALHTIDEHGEPNWFQYERLGVVHNVILRDHEDRIAKLEKFLTPA